MSDDHIDNLIYYLDHPSELSSDEETIVLRVNETERETIDNVQESVSEGASASGRLATLYRRSSSISKHIQKLDHCNFCQATLNSTNLEQHLRSSNRCLTLYERKLKVTSLDSILVRLLPCLYCDYKGGSKLQFHLQRNVACRQQYFERWNINIGEQGSINEINDGIKKITEAVSKLKRSSTKSRGKEARIQEHEKEKRKKEIRTTEEMSLNEFRHSTALSNYAKCLFCKSNRLLTEVTIVEEDEILNMEEMKDIDFKTLRRAEKYFRCSSCTQNNPKSFHFPDNLIIRMEPRQEDGCTKLVPTVTQNLVANDEQSEVLPAENTTVFFPCNIDSVDFAPAVPVKSVKEIPLLIYNSEEKFSMKDLATLYQNHLSRFKSAKVTGDLFSGRMKNVEEKLLSNVKKISSAIRIQGSDEWVDARWVDVSEMLRQLGKLALKVEVKLSNKSPAVVATVLMQQGVVISTTFEGDATQEQKINYMVHTGTYITLSLYISTDLKLKFNHFRPRFVR